jgi:glycosyltransferase involved in cell wall biosynthesis
MFFAPCSEVGGKRFSYLSQYLSREFSAYHVLARHEREPVTDPTAFQGNVHRKRMVPYYPSRRKRGVWHRLSRLWAKWLCQVDPQIGWVVPATISGVRLCRKHRLNIVIVTVPSFSSIIAAVLVSKISRCKLIIDYRDEWTNHFVSYRRPFGKYICPALERMAIRQASAIVVCTDNMRADFKRAFVTSAKIPVEIIYNGYDAIEDASLEATQREQISMMYAGTLYGKRQVTMLAPALLELLNSGAISAESFRLHVYSRLRPEQIADLERCGIAPFVEIHEPVPYVTIRRVMRESDILFLPSGDEFNYAIPFKFYDYLSARRPILAVASSESAVRKVMTKVNCGEFAEIGNTGEIVQAVTTLIGNMDGYTFQGVERFEWQNSATQYISLLNRTVQS